MTADWKLSNKTISALGHVICGDGVTKNGEVISPYRSGPDLVGFFNQLGFDDSYSWGGGFPSRWSFAEDRLTALNGSQKMRTATEAALDPAHFLNTDFVTDVAASYLNDYLRLDGFELRKSGDRFRLIPLKLLARVDTPIAGAHAATHEFIVEQLEKCDRKLADGDFDGAITNARSLVEAVLVDMERRLAAAPPAPDGDLPKLYKRVQKLLNLDPGRPDLTDNLRQILTGLSSVVAGLGALRNRMGDAHARSYKPEHHHAKLAVNAARTAVDFLFETFEYQKKMGLIKELARPSA